MDAAGVQKPFSVAFRVGKAERPKLLTGFFYDWLTLRGLSGTADGQTGALATNTLYVWPLHVPFRVTVLTLNLAVTTADGVGSAEFRIGIYRDSGGLPDTLVANSDSGVLSCGSTGNKQADVTDFVLDEGMYWQALAINATSPQFRCYRDATAGAAIGTQLGETSAAGSTKNYGYQRAFTFAALPASAGSFSTLTTIPNARIQLGT